LVSLVLWYAQRIEKSVFGATQRLGPCATGAIYILRNFSSKITHAANRDFAHFFSDRWIRKYVIYCRLDISMPEYGSKDHGRTCQ